MIDYKKVETVASIFVKFFIDLNTLGEENKTTFIENLLGFVCASKLVLKSTEIVDILTAEQIEGIEKELSSAVKQNMSKEKTKKLIEAIRDLKARGV